MKNNQKYVVLAAIVLVSVAADQVTKLWATARLANPRSHPVLIDGPHHFDIAVPEAAKGQTLKTFLETDLTGTDPDKVESIARRYSLVDGQRKPGDTILAGGETITVKKRDITVLEDFFHFKYTRNPGAAFGFLAQQDGDFRRPFFIVVSILAILIIGFIYLKVTADQKLLAISLSLIVGGAFGNLVDRIAYGWVIDFIDWHWYEHTWPTFNIADAAISVGVALMALEILVGMREPAEEGGDQKKKDPAPKKKSA